MKSVKIELEEKEAWLILKMLRKVADSRTLTDAEDKLYEALVMAFGVRY